MRSSYVSLLGGLMFAIVLVYMLIVVNFQSWLDPFIIITALPAALAGIVMLPFPDAHNAQRTSVDGRHHVHGRGDGEQHSGGLVCKTRLAGIAMPCWRPWKPGSRDSARSV